MPAAPEFSSLLVSRPSPIAPLLLRVRGCLIAIALYAAGLAALLVSPLFVLEMMKPPEAGLRPLPPPGRLVFHSPDRRSGDGLPAAPVRRGVRNGAERRSRDLRSRAPRALTAVSPLAAPASPPAADAATPGGPDDRIGDGGAQSGDPFGGDDSDGGAPGGKCAGCTGTGEGGPGGGDGPYDSWAAGLVPPRIIPSTRALPQYPGVARRAGLQGTVILLVVVEADGSVGRIEVIRSPDQRWGFDLAAIGAVKEWRYRPALMNDRPVASYIQVMVEFSLSR